MESKSFTRKSVIVAKSLILVFWYMVLVVMASLAFTGKASRILEKFSAVAIERPLGLAENLPEGTASHSPMAVIISVYDEDEFGIPAETFFDVLNAVAPDWADNNFELKTSRESKDRETSLNKEEPYVLLYIGVSNYLNALALDEDLDEKTAKFDKSIIPKHFKDILKEGDVGFPLSAQNWLQKKRKENVATDSKTNLVDTFFILVILGTFGSLIFLTKDLLSAEMENPLLMFVFRPLFGMALAVAVFIVAILAHALMTTAPLQNLRTETMYILGLGSGLLADAAYLYLKRKTGAGFVDDGEDNGEPVV